MAHIQPHVRGVLGCAESLVLQSPTPGVLTVNSPQISCLDPTSRVLTLASSQSIPVTAHLPLNKVSLTHV